MSKFDIAQERLKIRQEVKEGRNDLRNHLVPYHDIHEFEVQHYSDITNGLIKLLKNSEYLIDSIYYRIPTYFKFYSRFQYYKFDDGTEQPLNDSWYLTNEKIQQKLKKLIDIPQAQEYPCYEFSAWMTDQNCSAAIDFDSAYGPLSAYAYYVPLNYRIHFLDFYGNEVTDISTISIVKDNLYVSAFSDVCSIFDSKTSEIATKVKTANNAYDGVSDHYFLYKFDNEYPIPLSNVREDLYFRGIYTYIKDPIYVVHNYYHEYDAEYHGISIEFEEDNTQYHVEYSQCSSGPFKQYNILSNYTNDQEVSVFFKLSSYSQVLNEYVARNNIGPNKDGVDYGTIRIFSRHLVQEENRYYVLTDKANDSSNLSILM